MLRVFVAMITYLFLALPFVAHGSEESCPVEGITARWAISYCMTRFKTDDEAHAGVSACFLKEMERWQAEDSAEDCKANVVYKSAICSILIEWEIYDESLASCIASKEMIPTVVNHGAG